MKVVFKNETYLVHWKRSSNKETNVDTMTCIIRLARKDAEAQIVSRGIVSKHVNDKANYVVARKFAFQKALADFDIAEKRVFWKEYVRENRIPSKNYRVKKLEKTIVNLKNKIREMEKTKVEV